jgi:hypothetical protein
MTDRNKSYHWIFRTSLYQNTVDAAIKSGRVKTKTEYAVQLWLAYLKPECNFRDNAISVMCGFSWVDTPQGASFWQSINAWHGLLREQSKRTLK